jgi:hypothetical protein
MTYEGYVNYETWTLLQWINSNEEIYTFWTEQIKTDSLDVAQLAEIMEDHYRDVKPELEGAWSDLLQSAFDEIDWQEIAEGLI